LRHVRHEYLITAGELTHHVGTQIRSISNAELTDDHVGDAAGQHRWRVWWF
jgi:hypothetical protein